MEVSSPESQKPSELEPASNARATLREIFLESDLQIALRPEN